MPWQGLFETALPSSAEPYQKHAPGRWWAPAGGGQEASPEMTHSTTCRPREAAWDLPRDPAAVGKARALVREALASWGLTAMAETAAILVSELVTNAIVHGGDPVALHLIAADRAIRGEVIDHSTAMPTMSTPKPDDEGGRGLAIVEALASRWGVDPGHGSKAVWFTLTATA